MTLTLTHKFVLRAALMHKDVAKQGSNRRERNHEGNYQEFYSGDEADTEWKLAQFRISKALLEAILHTCDPV
jgi:hypothetical protein